MIDATPGHGAVKPDLSAKRLRKRKRAELRFQLYGLGAILLAVAFLVWFLTKIVVTGIPGFFQSYVLLEVPIEAELVDPEGKRSAEALRRGNYANLLRNALLKEFPDAVGRSAQRALTGLLSPIARYDLQDKVLADPASVGTTIRQWFLLSDDVDRLLKGETTAAMPQETRRLSDRQLAWIEQLAADGRIETRFDWNFFTAGNSAEPEAAGLGAAMIGSLYTMLVMVALCVPVGVMAAIYLEEFAPRNRLTGIIEININNLAAVPSIVFGLLGLAVFLGFFGLPRSAPLAGGLVLALMTLPTVIIATRAALKAVPPSIRQGAVALGASKLQAVTHHVLPLALPGILTGTIIGVAQALGETAPLLMIGMFAFVQSTPGSIFDTSTAIPVQIYSWADQAERAYEAKTSAAILVLLACLILMNAVAILLRRRFERRW
ncbi:MAG: phosphate ABC transporter permease PstA [Rhodospirillales bacterium]|nr:phosphate ABC transporter permease PstA [Rhodospirillales bacterium]